MRPGIAGLTPADPLTIQSQDVARVSQAGFTGISCYFEDPFAPADADLDRLRSVLAEGGVSVAQCNGSYPVLVCPDDVHRKKGIRAVQRLCGITRRLGAQTLYVRPGSLNPAGPWTPHPHNTSPSTIDRLVDSLKEICQVAEAQGVQLAIEGHVVSPLETPRRVHEVIHAVGSSALGFNADPVNLIGSLADAWDTAVFMESLFNILGDHTVAGHAKDIAVGNGLVLHLDEAAPGDGLLDHAAFLRLFEKASPDAFLLIEHLPDNMVAGAKTALDGAMAECGLRWRMD